MTRTVTRNVTRKSSTVDKGENNVKSEVVTTEKGELMGNDINEIDLKLAEDFLSTVQQSFGLSKKLTIGLAARMGLNYQDIATLVKTTRKYVKTALSELRKDAKSRQKFGELLASMPEWYKSSARAMLPAISEVENKAVFEYLKQPTLAIERPALLKQVKQAAGITFGDEQQATVQVNVGQIMQNILVEARQPKAIEHVIDAEVVESTKV